MVVDSTFSTRLSSLLDQSTLSSSLPLKTSLSSLHSVLKSSNRLSDFHFHAGLEAHGKLVAGVFERPIYGYGYWKGESDYYTTGLREKIEQEEKDVEEERREWEVEVDGLDFGEQVERVRRLADEARGVMERLDEELEGGEVYEREEDEEDGESHNEDEGSESYEDEEESYEEEEEEQTSQTEIKFQPSTFALSLPVMVPFPLPLQSEEPEEDVQSPNINLTNERTSLRDSLTSQNASLELEENYEDSFETYDSTRSSPSRKTCISSVPLDSTIQTNLSISDVNSYLNDTQLTTEIEPGPPNLELWSSRNGWGHGCCDTDLNCDVPKRVEIPNEREMRREKLRKTTKPIYVVSRDSINDVNRMSMDTREVWERLERIKKSRLKR